MIDLTSPGVVAAAATLVAAISAFIVSMRRSSADSDNHWQEMIRIQLQEQIARTTALSEELDIERRERWRIEASLTHRIALLESTLRSHGIAVPS